MKKSNDLHPQSNNFTQSNQTYSTNSQSNTPSENDSFAVRAPSVTLPKGGGAIRGIDEKFSVNPATGSASLSVPIFVSPGRAGFQPQLSLSYDSGGGNSLFGLGWNLLIPSISRKTAKGLPRYQDHSEPDTFILSGAEDLVPVIDKDGNLYRYISGSYQIERFRPRTEGLFARIERWTEIGNGDVHWRSVSKDNISSIYGYSEECRESDPENQSRIFKWLLEETYDAKGNVIRYSYKKENTDNSIDQIHENAHFIGGSKHIKRIFYGNRVPAMGNQPPPSGERKPDWHPYDRSDWLFEVVFDYGEHGDMVTFSEEWWKEPSEVFDDIDIQIEERNTWKYRPDSFSSYRAGFEQRTCRLCRRILMFHHMNIDDHPNAPYLVRSTDFQYDENGTASKLTAVAQTGYIRYNKSDDDLRYKQKSLPPIEYEYSEAKINRHPLNFDTESLKNLPQGVDGSMYRWIDLDGEGIPGILTEQSDEWYFFPNLGKGKFGPKRLVDPVPSLGKLAAGAQLIDLGGDGKLDCVVRNQGINGFFERTDDGNWCSFRSFTSIPNIDWNDPNLRLIDLTGDGLADILISRDEVFVWFPSEGKEGYSASERVINELDEEKGPVILFADLTQSIFLTDMSGDGLVDIVRIRNSEVCYWPNMGYGRFGRKITLSRNPEHDIFDHTDMFDPKKIILADIDGSGTTDLLYLGNDGIDVYLNQSGNSLKKVDTVTTLGTINSNISINVADVLGKGTACLVWSSSAPMNTGEPMKYIDLMSGGKPHLLISSRNNLGRENRFYFKSSTEYYLKDKLQGNNWITRIAFPVHVLEKIETYDHISRNRFTTKYAYHHGYFDGAEREFRGFGMVEQWDTDEFGSLTDQGVMPSGENIQISSHLPPAHTKTWFHTGAHLEGGQISRLFERDYYREGDESRGERGISDEHMQALLLPDTIRPEGLSSEEEREACRALRGSVLRQEIYADDQTDISDRPFSVSERNYTVKMLQEKSSNRHAVFYKHDRETIDYHYERTLVEDGDNLLADPRVSHQMTLAVDDFGNVERSVSIGYQRRDLPGVEEPEQLENHLTLTVNRFANSPDEDDWFLKGLPSESLTFEIVKPPAPVILNGIVTPFKFQDINLLTEDLFPNDQTHPDGDKLWLYEKWDWRYTPGNAPSDTRLRLIEHIRTYYRSNDLAEKLPLTSIESLGLSYESYRLALSRDLVVNVFDDKIDSYMLETCGYVHTEGDKKWWIPSGRIFYSIDRAHSPSQELSHARDNFFLQHRTEDPFGNLGYVVYDKLKLMVQSTRDALGNTTRAETEDDQGNAIETINYRILQPWLVTDPNENRNQVEFDILGMISATIVMGEKSQDKGDIPPEDLEHDLMEDELSIFLAAPRTEAKDLLGTATSRILYGLWAYYNTRTSGNPQPAYTAKINREIHVSELTEGQSSPLQIAFSYSDGFGREIQKKIQAEPGPLSPEGPVVNPRWVGSGWVIYNNKGNPVRQYEPFFSNTHTFQYKAINGVSSILFYDPLGRQIATLHANHTYEKTVFDPWRQAIWDVNDTVFIVDPKQDPDIGEYFACLKDSEYLPTWYTKNFQSNSATELSAAEKAIIHSGTPQYSYFDSLGRPFLTVDDNGLDTEGKEQKYKTHLRLDIEGNQRFITDAKDRVVMCHSYDLLSSQTCQMSMDAGNRWTLSDVMGNPLYAWDSRQHRLRYEYDELRRKTNTFLIEGESEEELVEEITYGEGLESGKNHRTRVYMVKDQAGIVSSDEYDFKGNIVQSTRQLANNYKTRLNWKVNQPLDQNGEESFVTTTVFDALNRPITLVQPDKTKIIPKYNEAGFIESIYLDVSGQEQLEIISNIDYNARGQRELVEHGNGVKTKYKYEKETFRLERLSTSRQNEPQGKWLIQDIHYTFDPSGNITAMQDDAQKIIYYNGQIVKPECDYTYDSLYRLIRATGREHIGQVAQTTWNDEGRTKKVYPQDGQKMRNYTEQYIYDSVGNIEEYIHKAANGDWTRSYKYEEPSLIDNEKRNNRLTSTSISEETSSYTYDEHGSMTSLPHISEMTWDFRDQLQRTSRQVVNNGSSPETTYYVYDSAGQRVRKVTETYSGTGNDPKRKQERIYLEPFEIYRKYDGNEEKELERQTITVKAADQTVAIMDIRTEGSDSSPAELMRFQYGNHIGSVCIELDKDAKVLTYEEYYPYGGTSYQAVWKDIGVPIKRIRYSGKERDEESGFYYYGARYYASWLGRWTASDPAGLADSTNVYSFTRSNPINNVDPTGTQCHTSDLSCIDPTAPTQREAPLQQSHPEAERDLSPPVTEQQGVHSAQEQNRKSRNVPPLAMDDDATVDKMPYRAYKNTRQVSPIVDEYYIANSLQDSLIFGFQVFGVGLQYSYSKKAELTKTIDVAIESGRIEQQVEQEHALTVEFVTFKTKTTITNGRTTTTDSLCLACFCYGVSRTKGENSDQLSSKSVSVKPSVSFGFGSLNMNVGVGGSLKQSVGGYEIDISMESDISIPYYELYRQFPSPVRGHGIGGKLGVKATWKGAIPVNTATDMQRKKAMNKFYSDPQVIMGFGGL